jgi:hypothetical protein
MCSSHGHARQAEVCLSHCFAATTVRLTPRSYKSGDPCRADGVSFTAHLDLHETTDTDESEFRPARASRDGESWQPGYIPDGFYLVADAEEPQPEWQAAIIASVKAVTHIAPPDDEGTILGEAVHEFVPAPASVSACTVTAVTAVAVALRRAAAAFLLLDLSASFSRRAHALAVSLLARAVLARNCTVGCGWWGVESSSGYG